MIPDRHILSRPHPVHWAGFRSDTLTLQQAGWEFSADQRMQTQEIELMMRHKAMGIHARTGPVPSMMYGYEMGSRPSFHIQWLTNRNVRWQHYNMPDRVEEYGAVDMQPQMIKVNDIEDLKIFAGCMARTQQLIVDPDDVNGMMERILELQDPARQEYYKQRLRESKIEGMERRASPRQKFHAQIVSLAA